ncbi:DUF748 domain-containing protein [uncultured Microbulbifer sp.]|uniref:DUF748 domain-containing protein n=1 Tax=uncultured Microbulbifer sp. TaxID=348147 RepID=UPI0025F89EC2|nr:DUF748 domain-containing protein [uncultured Microbulbifer sp.]
MSASSANTAEQQKGSRRLIWLLVFVLLFVGALNIFLASILPGAIQRWLGERGLEANIEHIQLSLPRLHVGLRGVEVRNQQGRGFSAREASLGLSWWYLLQGKIHVNLVDLEGVHFDLESLPGKRGRVWEIGGWLLGEGEKKAKNWRVDMAAARLRDGVVCYQHKPQWTTASCAHIDELALEDFTIAGRRLGQEPLRFTLGVDDLYLRNLLAWDEKPQGEGAASATAGTAAEVEAGEGDMHKSGREHPTLVVSRLKISDGLFRRPGNRITAEDIFARKIAGCPPRRWAAAVPGLKRIVGHCASSRRLELKGPLTFAFGKQATVAWRRASGQEVRLRYANRRLPNWRAETIAINRFEYLRAEKNLSWLSAGSTGFSWCPSRWRSTRQHYCLRAGSLRLPLPTAMAWADGFDFATREPVLQQGTLLDLDAKQPAKNPLNVNHLRAESIGYTGARRRLELQGLALDGAAGCIPGQLWQSPDQCVQLTQLAAPQTLAVDFPHRVRGQGLGISSGPFRLEQLRLAPAGAPEDSIRDDLLRVSKLQWARAALGSADDAQLLQDFAAVQLAGCVPERWLPGRQAAGDLCMQLAELQGEGSFSLHTGDTPHLILGKLQLDRLTLGDHLADTPDPSRGLVLSKLQLDSGLFRHSARTLADGEEPVHLPVVDDAFAAGDKRSAEDGAIAETAEKGQLPERLAGEGESTPDNAAETEELTRLESLTEAELESLSLSSMEGCLAESWQQLIYSGQNYSGKAWQNRPQCVDIQNLQQRQPLHLVLARESGEEHRGRLRFHFDAAALSLDKARVTALDERELLALEQLRLPRVEISLDSSPLQAQVDVPRLALDRVHFCLSPERCVNGAMLRTGEQFVLDYNRHRFRADLNNLAVEEFALSGPPQAFTARADKLESLQLKAQLPRRAGAHADWQMQNLQAEALEVCWPEQAPGEGAPSRLPRCVRASDVQSRGQGLQVARIGLQQAPGASAPTQLAVNDVSVVRLGLAQPARGPLQLNLHGLALESVRGCGLEQWLPEGATGMGARNWAGCLSSGRIQLTGDNLVALGSASDAADVQRAIPRLDFGAARAANLALRRQAGGQPQIAVRDIHWRALRWPGGRQLQVEELAVRDVSGCLPSVRGQVPTADPLCGTLAQLTFSGRQQLRLGPALEVSGHLELAGFAASQGGRKRIAINSLQVDGLLLDRERLVLDAGEVSGVSGCLPEFRLGEKTLSPCLQVGRVQMQREHRVALGHLERGGSQRHFRNIRVEGLQLKQRDFPADLPAQLLNVELLEADVLAVGRRLLQAENLLLKNISSCLPRGYLEKVEHCVHVAEGRASGGFDLDQRSLTLAAVELADVLLVHNRGMTLFESTRVSAEQFQWLRKQVAFAQLNVAQGKLFRRRENAEEFSRRQWNSGFEQLQVNRFLFDPAARQLDIDTVYLLQPNSMLARGRGGDFGAWEFLLGGEQAPGEAVPHRYRRGDLSREAGRFHYHIGEVVVDDGRFLWQDNYHEYSARLPIDEINILLRGVSSASSDPPALLLVNARPGGFGDLQLAGRLDLLPDQKWDASLLGYIVAANLIPATPYMANLLGYKILQGQLDAELNIQVDDNEVDALADMLLEKIKVRRVRDLDHLKVKRTLIPLSLALALIKNGKGDVQFKMPVTGDLYDPKFNFSFIFSDLLQRAIMESLFAYFTPVGFYSLAKLAWARFRAVDFDPVEFAPGSKELSATARAQLSDSVALMRDNPQARPGICGISTALDMRALHADDVARSGATREAREEFLRDPPREIREEMRKLAYKRSEVVQRYLLEAGLNAEDFIQCAPDYIGTDFDQPRVEMSN